MKNSLKIRFLKIFAKVSYYTGLTLLFLTFSEKINKKERVTILMYHRIIDIKNYPLALDAGLTTIGEFERHIEYISKNYSPISFNEFIERIENKKNLPKNQIIVTIDDGYKDGYINAYHILQRYNVPATFFLATDYIDSQELFWWDKVAYSINNAKSQDFSIPELGTYSLEDKMQRAENIGDIIKKLKKIDEKSKNKIINELVNTLKVEFDNELTTDLFLTWEEIKEMNENGMDFGAHSCSHAIMTKVPYEQAEYEIMESKRVIESQINEKVKFFSYPSGTVEDFDEGIKKILENNEFKAAITTIYGINKLNSETDWYSLKRIDINAGINIYLFKLELTGVVDGLYWIRNKLKRKG